MGFLVELHPERIEHPFAPMDAMAHPAQPPLGRRHGNFLAGPAAEEIDPERPVDREHIEAEKAEHRPGAHQQERKACGETDHAEKHHQHQKTGAVQRTLWGEQRGKQFRLRWPRIKVVAWCHYVSVYPIMAKINRRTLTKSQPPPPQAVKKSHSPLPTRPDPQQSPKKPPTQS